MQAERAYLHEVVFPSVAEKFQASGYTLEIVDPRLTATNEEEAEGLETLEAALDEVAACQPYFLCLLGNNYGKVTLEVPEAIGRKHPAVRHFFRTSRVHLETLTAVIREPHNAHHSFFYVRKPQIVTKLFDADKQNYVPNNKMEALNEVEAHKLEIFKEAIVRTGRPVFYYGCQWDSASRQLTGFEQLGARIENDLLSMVGLAEPSAAVVEETVPGSMATEEMAGGSMLAGAAVAGGVAVAGAAALAGSKLGKGGRRGLGGRSGLGAAPEDGGYDTMPEEQEVAAVAPVDETMPDAASAFADDAAIDQIVADAAEVPDDGSPAALAGDGAFGANPFETDDAAAALLSGGDNPFEEAPADDNAAAMLNDAPVADGDAEAAAMNIFGSDAPAEAPADDNSFEVDGAMEDSQDIVAEEEEVMEIVEEEEEEAPKKKKEKKGWFGKKK
jgi:hypothetical protein